MIHVYAGQRVWERGVNLVVVSPHSRFTVFWRKFRLIESKGFMKGLYLKRVDDIALARFTDDDRDYEEQTDAFLDRMKAKQQCGHDEYCLTWLKMGQYMNPYELSLLSEIISGGRVDATVVKDWMMDRM